MAQTNPQPAVAWDGTGALAMRLDYEGRPVRVLGSGERPLFVVADVCEVLGLSNPAMAVAKLDADEKGVRTVDTPGGPQEMLCVTEPGEPKGDKLTLSLFARAR